jgi:hypothetical protein
MQVGIAGSMVARRLSSSTILVSCLCAALIAHNTIGFDLYSHSVAHSSIESFANLYKYYEIGGAFFPRYLLLSDFYILLGLFGIPLGFTVFGLYFISIVQIIEAAFKPSRSDLRKPLVLMVYFPIILVTCVYYSALSLSVLWMIAYFVSDRPFLLMSSVFHPFSLVMILVLMIFRKSCRYGVVYILLGYIIVTIGLSYMQDRSSSAVNVFLLVDFLSESSISTIETKTKEIVILTFGFVCIAAALRVWSRSINPKTCMHIFLVIAIFSHLTLILATWNKFTLFNSSSSREDNHIMACTWLSSRFCQASEYSSQRSILK